MDAPFKKFLDYINNVAIDHVEPEDVPRFLELINAALPKARTIQNNELALTYIHTPQMSIVHFSAGDQNLETFGQVDVYVTNKSTGSVISLPRRTNFKSSILDRMSDSDVEREIQVLSKHDTLKKLRNNEPIDSLELTRYGSGSARVFPNSPHYTVNEAIYYDPNEIGERIEFLDNVESFYDNFIDSKSITDIDCDAFVKIGDHDIQVKISELFEEGVENHVLMIENTLGKLRKKANPIFENINTANYLSAELNFIAQGKDEDIQKYRYQFIEKVRSMTQITTIEDMRTLANMANKNGPNGYVEKPSALYRPFLFDSTGRRTKEDPEYLALIDKGIFPIKYMTEKLGMPKATKPEIAEAFHHWGRRYVDLAGKSKEYNSSTHRMYSYNHSIESAFELASIPKVWLTDADRELSEQNVKFPNEEPSTEKLMQSDVSKRLIALSPWIHKFGRDLRQARVDGDKPLMRKLASENSWLTGSNGTPLHDKMLKLDEKYKMLATKSDYSDMLTNLFNATRFRTLLDNEDFFATEVTINDDNQLIIDPLYLDEIMRDEWAEDRGVEIDPEEPLVDFDASEVTSFTDKNADSITELLKLNEVLHKRYNKQIVEMNKLSPDSQITWSEFMTGGFPLGKYTVHGINDRISLLDEGTSMNHCAFSYLGKCMAGESFLLSMRDKDDNRVATLEIIQDHDGAYSLEQCYGYDNERVESEVELTAEEFLENLNDGTIEVNPDITLNREEINIDHALENGHIFNEVPYHTDAAHMAVFFIEKHLPSGKSYNELLKSGTGAFRHVFDNSQFGRDIALIRELASQYKLPPEEIIASKVNGEFPTYVATGEHLALREKIEVTIAQTLHDDLTHEQNTNRVHLSVSNNHNVELDKPALKNAICNNQGLKSIASTPIKVEVKARKVEALDDDGNNELKISIKR